MTTLELLATVRRVAAANRREFDRLPEAFTILRSALARPVMLVEAKSPSLPFIRAQPVPDGWLILNAPRPLFGEILPFDGWGHGRHWTVIDPESDMAPVFLRKSLELDGWLVEFVGQEDFDQHAAEVCAKYKFELEDFDAADRRQSYFQAHERLVVKMEEGL